MAVVTLVTNKNKYTWTKQYKITVQSIQNTVNTSTHITKIPIHTHTSTLQNPYIQTPTHNYIHKIKSNIITINNTVFYRYIYKAISIPGSGIAKHAWMLNLIIIVNIHFLIDLAYNFSIWRKSIFIIFFYNLFVTVTISNTIPIMMWM